MTSDPQGNPRLVSVNDRTALANLSFSDAAPVWFASHSLRIRPGTRRNYELGIAALKTFLGALPLREIDITHFEQYQKLRSAGAPGLRKAGPSTINHELNTLSQILNCARLWAAIEPHYRPLPLPCAKGRCAPSSEEEARLLRIAASNPRWIVAYCCALLTARTTATPNEIRNLRLRDGGSQLIDQRQAFLRGQVDVASASRCFRIAFFRSIYRLNCRQTSLHVA